MATLRQPFEQTRFGMAQVHVGDAHVVEAERRAPGANLRDQRMRIRAGGVLRRWRPAENGVRRLCCSVDHP